MKKTRMPFDPRGTSITIAICITTLAGALPGSASAVPCPAAGEMLCLLVEPCPVVDPVICIYYDSLQNVGPEGCVERLDVDECRRDLTAPIPPECRFHFNACVDYLWDTCLEPGIAGLDDDCFVLFEDLANYYNDHFLFPLDTRGNEYCSGRGAVDGSTVVVREPINYRAYPYAADPDRMNFGEFILVGTVTSGYEYSLTGLTGDCAR